MSNHPEQGVILVEKGAGVGRSAYFCRNEQCIEAAVAKGRLARALKSAVPQERLDSIKKELICKLQ